MDRPKLPFAQIKREVSVADVARRYGFTLKQDGEKKGLHGLCRLPTHTSKESKSSFSINLNGNYWTCFSDSCKANRNGKLGGDVITLVHLMDNNCGYYEAAKKLMEDFHIQAPDYKAEAKEKKPFVVPAPEKKPEPQEAEATAVNAPLTFAGFKEVDHAHQYLVKRGIRPETAKAFGVGFYGGKSSVIKDPYRIVIPIHNAKGELVAYVGRALNDAADKYHFPSGFHKSAELFNLHRVHEQTKTICVVEGMFDTLKVYQAGYRNVVGLMGCTMSKMQEDTLAAFPNVIVMLDGDKAGREGASTILQRLSRRTFVKAIDLPDGLQPDGLSSGKIKEILGNL